MTNSSAWNTYCNNLFTSEEIGFFLDLSCTGIDDSSYQRMEEIFQSAFLAMHQLEKGAISNPDENRQVGHYWLRNPELAPTPILTREIEETLRTLEHFSAQILSGKRLTPSGETFTHLLVIGVGGSALGPQFIEDALHQSRGLTSLFLDNTDPDGINRTLNNLLPHLSRTLVMVISKSGGTAETQNGMLETQHKFSDNQLDFAKQAVAITGDNSQLYQRAMAEKWLAIFPMWDWVGGRTSVMSAVGLLPAALAGTDIQRFLNGARLMDELTRIDDVKSNPAALLAMAWYILGNGRGERDMVILPYKDRLLLFSRYLQQLIMESIGKSHDLDGKLVQQGIAVYGNKGSTDQHAYVQQLRDGLDNFFVTFIEVLKDQQGNSILVDEHNNSGDYLFGFYKGTQTALQNKQRPSLTITITEMSPKTIGALIALYERAVGFYASLVNINAYHQPGVEAGKRAAGFVLETKNRIIRLLKTTEQSLNIPEICSQLQLMGQEALVYDILRHHAANNNINVEGSFFQPESLKVNIL